MANALTLEHPSTAPARRAVPPIARLQAQLAQAPLQGWRFPAEFRLRPTGWTERGLARPAPSAAPGEPASLAAPSSSGLDAFSPLMLDSGPAGVSPDAFVSEAGSNVPVHQAAPPLAYAAAPPIVGTFGREPEQSIAIGQATAPPLAELTRAEGVLGSMSPPRDDACGCSNGAAYAQMREIGAFSIPGQRIAVPERFSALTAGDPSAWTCGRQSDAAPSYATSYG